MPAPSPGTKVLFEKPSSQGPYYPDEVIEGRVMDPAVLKRADWMLRQKVAAAFHPDGAPRSNYVIVNSGIHEIPKFAMDLHVVLVDRLVY